MLSFQSRWALRLGDPRQSNEKPLNLSDLQRRISFNACFLVKGIIVFSFVSDGLKPDNAWGSEAFVAESLLGILELFDRITSCLGPPRLGILPGIFPKSDQN